MWVGQVYTYPGPLIYLTQPSPMSVQEILNVGEPTMIISESPSESLATMFEDDGETGYFYAMNLVREKQIVDAVHIYNVASVVDRHRQSQVEIVWAADGMKSALLINRYPHAVFDFSAKRGYCRTGFPDSSRGSDGWSEKHEGVGSVMKFFDSTDRR